MAQSPTLTKWHVCLQQRSTLCSSPLLLEMWMLLGPVEYVDPPDALAPIPVAAAAACREGAGKIPTDAWYTDGTSWGNLATRTVVTIQPNTDIMWMETGMKHSSWRAELKSGFGW